MLGTKQVHIWSFFVSFVLQFICYQDLCNQMSTNLQQGIMFPNPTRFKVELKLPYENLFKI